MNLTDQYKGKKALVLGGLGFIGSTISEELLKMNVEVFLIDNLDPNCGGNEFNIESFSNHPKLHVHKTSMADEEVMKDILPKIDFVFNMVGHVSHMDSIKNPSTDLKINLIDHISFLELCKKYNPNVKIGYASTRGVYGKPQETSIDEEGTINPIDFNGINKFSAEKYHLFYSNFFNINSFVIRLTNTYGPKMRIKDSRQGFICLFIKQALVDEEIKIFGTGNQLRDFNYVTDVTCAFLHCMINQEANNQIFNIGGHSISVKKCAEEIVHIAESGKILFEEYPEDNKKIEIGNYKADYSKICKLINWQPLISFEEGIKKTLSYYTTNKNKYL